MAGDHPVFAPGLFEGKTALVTGGGRGLGRAIALAFARLGGNVVIAGRNEDSLKATRAELEAVGVQALAVPTNIREVEQVERLVAVTVERFSQLHFLVNNAGGQFPARPSEITDRGWRSVVDLNLNGTWNMLSRVGPHMIRQKSGAIVNVVHIYSFDRGSPGWAHSGAARAGVVNLTRSLAYYWARHGVRVNALAPGMIDTAGMRKEELEPMGGDAFLPKLLDSIPAHRLATAEEIADIALFLCSPAAAYINGAAIVADGGAYLGDWPLAWDVEQP